MFAICTLPIHAWLTWSVLPRGDKRKQTGDADTAVLALLEGSDIEFHRQRKVLTLAWAARRDVVVHRLMGWDMVPCVGSVCRGLCDAGCGGEIALSKEERVKLERWDSTAISEEFDGNGIERDGPDLVYPLGPGSHTFTVSHSLANS